MKKRFQKISIMMTTISLFLMTRVMPVYADVADVIEDAWGSAESQIKSVVNNVVFPALDLVLAVFFFVKLGSAYFDYRKNGQNFEWQGPAILFVCLCFTLTAPLYIWNIIP